jgi:hypothetical protein
MSAVRQVSGLGQIAAISVRDAANALHAVGAGEVRDAGNMLQPFFSALSASAAPEETSGFGNDGSAISVSTGSVTVTVEGGVAPFTPLWARTDGGGTTWAISDHTAASTSFSTSLAAGDSDTATFACTVTDATGATAVSNDITATAVNLGGGVLIGGGA